MLRQAGCRNKPVGRESPLTQGIPSAVVDGPEKERTGGDAQLAQVELRRPGCRALPGCVRPQCREHGIGRGGKVVASGTMRPGLARRWYARSASWLIAAAAADIPARPRLPGRCAQPSRQSAHSSCRSGGQAPGSSAPRSAAIVAGRFANPRRHSGHHELARWRWLSSRGKEWARNWASMAGRIGSRKQRGHEPWS